MRSARQALADIAAWADDMDGSEPVFLDRLRAILADVELEPAPVDLPYDPVFAIEQLHLCEGAGWRDREKFVAAVTSILRDVRVIVHVPHLDMEAHAASFNEGYEKALEQIVEPEPAVVWDRDAARDMLRAWDLAGCYPADNVLDALEACVRPAPPRTIDRDDAAEAAFNAARRDDWGVANEDEREEFYDIADAVLALLRPVDGFVLTREEAALAASALRFGHRELFGIQQEPANRLRARLDTAW